MDKKKIFLASETIRKLFRDSKLDKEDGAMVLATSLCGFCGGDTEHIMITGKIITEIAIALGDHTFRTNDNHGTEH